MAQAAAKLFGSIPPSTPKGVAILEKPDGSYRLIRPVQSGDERLDLVVYRRRLFAVIGEGWSWE
jgi:hypothetical protein